jgi:hypothetical protein
MARTGPVRSATQQMMILVFRDSANVHVIAALAVDFDTSFSIAVIDSDIVILVQDSGLCTKDLSRNSGCEYVSRWVNV